MGVRQTLTYAGSVVKIYNHKHGMNPSIQRPAKRKEKSIKDGTKLYHSPDPRKESERSSSGYFLSATHRRDHLLHIEYKPGWRCRGTEGVSREGNDHQHDVNVAMVPIPGYAVNLDFAPAQTMSKLPGNLPAMTGGQVAPRAFARPAIVNLRQVIEQKNATGKVSADATATFHLEPSRDSQPTRNWREDEIKI
jgi:hypothetical protein